MKSIKTKLFFGISLLLSLFVIGIVIYGLTFKEFYIDSKSQELVSVVESFENFNNKENESNINDYISEMLNKHNIQVDIIDNSSNSLVYGATIDHINRKVINGLENLTYLGKTNGIVKYISQDKITGIKFLNFSITSKNNEYTIIAKSPISAIDNSVYKSIELLLIILLPLTIIMIILTFIFSKSFTRPILKITKNIKKLEKLDFSEKLDIKTKDEIGQLGNSVNTLSHNIKNYVKELEDKNKSLEEYIKKERENEVLNKEFVSSVSHELKTPITVISGYVQMLKSGIIKNEDDKKYYLDTIEDETNRMELMVNDLLDLYKLESNTFKIKKENVRLDELIINIINKLEFKFNKENIILQDDLDKIEILCDKIRIEQAITNYINNALSHVDAKRIIKISVKDERNFVYISVFNTGENINTDDLSKIWKGFVRVDKVRNHKTNRVGLGLAIVEQIVRLHNGEKGVLNKKDGIEFFIKLSKV